MKTSTNFLEPSSPEILAFRARVDLETNEALAQELELRARYLRETPQLPEDERRPYDEVVRLVRSQSGSVDGKNEWRLGRIARWTWATGDGVWHSAFVITGTLDGHGCDCNRPECLERRKARERRRSGLERDPFEHRRDVTGLKAIDKGGR